MTPKCNLVAGMNGHVICAKSAFGCTRACPRHPEHEKFKIEQLARPPIYERQEDTGEGVWKRNRE